MLCGGDSENSKKLRGVARHGHNGTAVGQERTVGGLPRGVTQHTLLASMVYTTGFDVVSRLPTGEAIAKTQHPDALYVGQCVCRGAGL